MANYKMIKVSSKNHAMLLREAAKLQYQKGEKASFDDVISELGSQKNENPNAKLLEFAGAWSDMSEEDYQKIKKSIADKRKPDLKRQKYLENLWK